MRMKCAPAWGLPIWPSTAAALAASPFLAKLTALMDDGALAGRAGLEALHSLHPGMQSVREWLAHTGRNAFHQALGTTGTWAYDGAERSLPIALALDLSSR